MKRFLLAFGVVALLIAGGMSYLADSDPDGLDTMTLRGCHAVDTAGGEQLRGDCMARSADDHAFSDGPLAGYTIGGIDALGGIAGVLGVVATALIGTGMFWTLRDRRRGTASRAGTGPETQD